MNAAFRAHLSKESLSRLGMVEAKVHASPTEIGAAAAAIQEQLKVGEERELVDRLREGSPVAVSTGVQETLDCLSEGRVLTLVADDSYAAEASIAASAGVCSRRRSYPSAQRAARPI
jgi:hypothetical protein